MPRYACLLSWLLATLPATADEALDTYVQLGTGSFSSAAQAAVDDRYGTAIWHIVEIWTGDDDRRWLYAENWTEDADGPYRQRIVRLTMADDGSILARGFRIPDAGRFVGAWEDPARLSQLDERDLEPVTGCDVTIVRTGEQRFEGHTHGRRCRSSHRGADYMVSQSVLTEDIMVNWDRGIAANGEQVWGPETGGYRFHRIGDDDEMSVCKKPVRMVVFGEIHDREAFAAYPKAIAASGLYPRLQGYYEAITPALEVFEGDPPPGRGVVVSRFPCLEAARQFWFSEQYQSEIMPLREGIAEFEVLVLPALPIPDYIGAGVIGVLRGADSAR